MHVLTDAQTHNERNEDAHARKHTRTHAQISLNRPIVCCPQVGARLKEAQNINKSLSALVDVITALASKQSHVPFRCDVFA